MSTDSTTPLKRCPTCGREFPVTAEYFTRSKQTKSGFYPACKECKAADGRKRYAENPEHRQRILDRTSEYQKNNPEKSREKVRRFYQNHRAEELERSREYHRANPDVTRRSNEKHRAEYAERERQRKRDNPEYYKQRSREYYQSHKAEALHRWRIRRARKLQAGGTHTKQDLAAIRAAQTDKAGRLICWKCGEPITDTPHLDHWWPLKHGGPDDAGNLHYMHHDCNRSKGAKLPYEIGRLI